MKDKPFVFDPTPAPGFVRQTPASFRKMYFDADGQIVPEEEKERAFKVMITEYDQDGNVINEVIGFCNNEQSIMDSSSAKTR